MLCAVEYLLSTVVCCRCKTTCMRTPPPPLLSSCNKHALTPNPLSPHLLLPRYTSKHMERHEDDCTCLDCVNARAEAGTLTAERARKEQAHIIHEIKRAMSHKREVFGQEVTKVEELFKAVDRDNSGGIDREEFEDLFKRLGIALSSEQINNLFTSADDDWSGTIELEELKLMIENAIMDDPAARDKRTATTMSRFAPSAAELGIAHSWTTREKYGE